MTTVLGPIGKRVGHSPTDQRLHLIPETSSANGGLSSSNGTLILRRVALNPGSEVAGQRAAVTWAVATQLGQKGAETVRIAAAKRRRALLVELAAAPGFAAAQLTLTPEWKIAIGLGDKIGVTDIGISLSDTHGWPVIPASALKGLARHWAESSDTEGEDIDRVLGSVRISPMEKGTTGDVALDGRVGTVTFLDAEPFGTLPVEVKEDVLTPHHQPYYRRHTTSSARDRGGPAAPPAGWNNPIPAPFLTLGSAGGPLVAGVVGPTSDVQLVAKWFTEAVDELGLGGKTAAGYGYASVAVELIG